MLDTYAASGISQPSRPAYAELSAEALYRIKGSAELGYKPEFAIP